jgi:hypothetical protein
MRFFILVFTILLATAELAAAEATCADCHEAPKPNLVVTTGDTTTVTTTENTKTKSVTTVTVPTKAKPELGKTVVANSKKYLKLREKTNHNDAPEIDTMLKYVGLDNKAEYRSKGQGYSWCAAFVLYNYYEASNTLGLIQPLPKTAGVANLWNKTKANPIRYRTIPASQVRLGLVKLQPGDVIIWKHGSAAFTLGHTGVNEQQLTMSTIFSIEGNTSGKGLSREGGGVFENERTISATGSMQIVGFIRPIIE